MSTVGFAVESAERLAVAVDPSMVCGPPVDVEQVTAAIADAIKHEVGAGAVELESREASDDELACVHNRFYVQTVHSLDAEGGALSASTWLRPGGELAAREAAGTAVQAIEAIFNGVVDRAVVALGPPGHHAGPDHGTGWCVFNNVATAAASALRRVPRVMIIDWDAHHGDGTQSIFWDRAEVLTVSLHHARWFAPDTGGIDACQVHRGRPINVNVPLPHGAAWGAYERAWSSIVVPAARRFEPSCVIVAAGLDAAFLDPMARLRLTSRDFYELASRAIELAKDLCSGRLLLSLEGAYSPGYSPVCGAAMAAALVGNAAPDDPFIERWSLDKDMQLLPAERDVISCVANALDAP